MKIEHDPLQDAEVTQEIDKILKTLSLETISLFQHQEFDTAWRKWITQSCAHKITGLEQFEHSCFVPGTTDAFGEFLARHNCRRIRVSASDFKLTEILARSWCRDLLFLEHGPLMSNDCVIISLPYSGNGSVHPEYNQILEQANSLDVPIFLDAAYFGISYGLDYQLYHRCITDIVFSLSKNFSTKSLRLGVRFTKQCIDDCASAALLGYDIFDRLNAWISVQILQRFPQSWIVDKYLPVSLQVCKTLGLQHTNTLTLALGHEKMQEFKRGDYIRVAITDELLRHFHKSSVL